MEISGKQLEIKIDTGAKCNVITLDLFKRISRNEKIDQTKAVQLVVLLIGMANYLHKFIGNLNEKTAYQKLGIVKQPAGKEVPPRSKTSPVCYGTSY